ncbi:LmeA family phospholipid-binding protein [Mobilicoccus pelagius]|uniref:LmeA family phospholipid-binding protein n=1 Tax=Mobilicoccus pelagius TaxID=746032 RepID=UPI0002D74658|nr:LmeA family phospholipid-binding protein [Mobilicoccus pelagius]
MIRVFAVLGVVFLALLLAGLVALVGLTRPLSGAPGSEVTAPSSPTAPAPPTDLAEGEAWISDADVASPRILLGEGQDLRAVKAKIGGVRLAADGTIHLARLDLDGVVPFSVVEDEVGRGIRLAPAEDGLVRVTVPVGAFGRGLDVTALARVQADGERIAVTPVRVLGEGLLDGELPGLPAIRQPVPNLPPGMRLTDVAVETGGFRIRAVGDDVRLSR